MNKPAVLAFDVFGTVVDWYGPVSAAVKRVCPQVDADAFALAWREGYPQAMRRVMAGELGWTTVDQLHLMILRDLLQRFKVDNLDEAQILDLNNVWHRLDPWPDSVEGLQRLKAKYMICTLSNGNIGLLANMAKHGRLPWDCILSAEIFRKYKPDPAVYLGVGQIFGIPPSSVMMVAAHQEDLAGARKCGLQTAYIQRPAEFGPHRAKDVSDNGLNTLHASAITALADQLDA
ncbi:MAG TPA: haloacid dehalogenase type II [Noviherbaspirillum sp.]|jgi:2-haloacid dehalogenase|uniref:haloacid dehalogenase type II n=1 Tax=Noviherbaspirillum sp. TaxID=1926288 RepID=UPI002F9256B5